MITNAMDLEVRNRVRNFLTSKGYGLSRLDVEVTGGAVHLSGRVSSFYQKQLAISCTSISPRFVKSTWMLKSRTNHRFSHAVYENCREAIAWQQILLKIMDAIVGAGALKCPLGHEWLDRQSIRSGAPPRRVNPPHWADLSHLSHPGFTMPC